MSCRKASSSPASVARTSDSSASSAVASDIRAVLLGARAQGKAGQVSVMRVDHAVVEADADERGQVTVAEGRGVADSWSGKRGGAAVRSRTLNLLIRSQML